MRHAKWQRNRSLLLSASFPAPLARAAGERDKAGTHAPGPMLIGRVMNTTPRGAATCRKCDGWKSRRGAWVPALTRLGLAGPSGAGMTLVDLTRGVLALRANLCTSVTTP